jgi:oligosaccharyltransferase complex subunit gamma
MRLLKLLGVAALSVTALAAKKPSGSLFDKYHPKQTSKPVEIDEQAYNDLTATPRDYSLAVLLTARPAKYACQLCRDFDPEWDIIARSWSKGDRKGENRLLLSTLDFDQGRNIFMKVRKLGCEITT